jgi:hypothetical protein
MSKVAIKGNPLGTGTFTIEAPNSDTNSTILLPVGGGSVVLTDATQTLTNKTISGANNTVSNLAASSVSSGTFDAARIPDLAATKITSGTFDAARIPNLDANKITSGTVATARLASGTANSTTFLRGDQTWQTISTTPTTDQVLTATAGASVGAVGTYALLHNNSVGTNTTQGSTLAGSSLLYTSAAFRREGSPAGTWRSMGRSTFSENQSAVGDTVTLFLRIS